jgi:hypothetical protein
MRASGGRIDLNLLPGVDRAIEPTHDARVSERDLLRKSAGRAYFGK